MNEKVPDETCIKNMDELGNVIRLLHKKNKTFIDLDKKMKTGYIKINGKRIWCEEITIGEVVNQCD